MGGRDLREPRGAHAVPEVRDWLLAHAIDVQDMVTRLIAYLGTGTVTVLAAEKGLSAVKPVAPAA